MYIFFLDKEEFTFPYSHNNNNFYNRSLKGLGASLDIRLGLFWEFYTDLTS